MIRYRLENKEGKTIEFDGDKYPEFLNVFDKDNGCDALQGCDMCPMDESDISCSIFTCGSAIGTNFSSNFESLELTELDVTSHGETALNTQVGGSHYKDMAIQPIEFTHKNNLNFCQGNVIKYITRYKNKNGIEDLKKVKHYVDLLIELEYGE